jgi:hypothetical protein
MLSMAGEVLIAASRTRDDAGVAIRSFGPYRNGGASGELAQRIVPLDTSTGPQRFPRTGAERSHCLPSRKERLCRRPLEPRLPTRKRLYAHPNISRPNLCKAFRLDRRWRSPLVGRSCLADCFNSPGDGLPLCALGAALTENGSDLFLFAELTRFNRVCSPHEGRHCPAHGFYR